MDTASRPVPAQQPHPGARRGVAGETIDAFEHLARPGQVATGEQDVAEVQLRVRQCSRVVAAPAAVGALPVQPGGAVQVLPLDLAGLAVPFDAPALPSVAASRLPNPGLPDGPPPLYLTLRTLLL